MIDARLIADALMEGRCIPDAKVRRLLTNGDSADALYAGLFQIIREASISPEVAKAVATLPDHPQTGMAWSYILNYASTPSGANFRKIVSVARDASDTAGTIMRPSPLILKGSHRRRFKTIVQQVARQQPALAAELGEVLHDLKQRGPGRLYAHRRVIAAKR